MTESKCMHSVIKPDIKYIPRICPYYLLNTIANFQERFDHIRKIRHLTITSRHIFNVDMGYVRFKKELLHDGNLDVMVGTI